MTTILTLAVVYTVSVFLAKSLMLRALNAPAVKCEEVLSPGERVEQMLQRSIGVLMGCLAVSAGLQIGTPFAIGPVLVIGMAMGALAGAIREAGLHHLANLEAQSSTTSSNH